MGRARAKISPTDQHARRIAVAIAKGRPPPFTPDLELYLESSPHEIFAAFEGAARHMPPAGKDADLAFGYLFLLQGLLERLRYRTDCGYPDAARLIAKFQAEVAARAEAADIDGGMLAYVGGALHESKIPASPELAAVSARLRVNDGEGGPLPADVRAALAGSLEACGGDPFVLVGSLFEIGHAMPGEMRGLWPLAWRSPAHPTPAAPRSCSCSIPIRLSAGRSPERLPRWRLRYRRRSFGG